jgi:hypothetical protein
MSEIMLKAARLAYPQVKWVIYASPYEGEGTFIYPEGKLCDEFEIDDLADQMALQIALEDKGWIFCKTGGVFEARLIFPVRYCEAPTKPALLLKCTEAL